MGLTGVWLFPGVLEGLGSSGRLIGTISTYHGTYRCPGSRAVAKNLPGGIFFTEYGMPLLNRCILPAMWVKQLLC